MGITSGLNNSRFVEYGESSLEWILKGKWEIVDRQKEWFFWGNLLMKDKRNEVVAWDVQKKFRFLDEKIHMFVGVFGKDAVERGNLIRWGGRWW